MNYSGMLKRAVDMKYKFLFHSKEQEADFFNNPDSIIVNEEDENVILFLERDGGVNSLYWAGESLKEVAACLGKLKDKVPKGTIIKISCGEDKNSEGLIDKISKEFLNVGCEIEFHYLGLKTSNLDGIQADCREVVKAKFEESNDIYGIIDRSLGGEKFKMNEAEIKEYMNDIENNVFIIRDNQKIEGVVFANIYGNKSNNTKSLFIRGLAVDEKYRGKGYSKNLMRRAFEWGMENGAISSMLWVEKYNKVAISLYEKFGYKAYGDEEIILNYVV